MVVDSSGKSSGDGTPSSPQKQKKGKSISRDKVSKAIAMVQARSYASQSYNKKNYDGPNNSPQKAKTKKKPKSLSVPNPSTSPEDVSTGYLSPIRSPLQKVQSSPSPSPAAKEKSIFHFSSFSSGGTGSTTTNNNNTNNNSSSSSGQYPYAINQENEPTPRARPYSDNKFNLGENNEEQEVSNNTTESAYQNTYEVEKDNQATSMTLAKISQFIDAVAPPPPPPPPPLSAQKKQKKKQRQVNKATSAASYYLYTNNEEESRESREPYDTVEHSERWSSLSDSVNTKSDHPTREGPRVINNYEWESNNYDEDGDGETITTYASNNNNSKEKSALDSPVKFKTGFDALFDIAMQEASFEKSTGYHVAYEAKKAKSKSKSIPIEQPIQSSPEGSPKRKGGKSQDPPDNAVDLHEHRNQDPPDSEMLPHLMGSQDELQEKRNTITTSRAFSTKDVKKALDTVSQTKHDPVEDDEKSVQSDAASYSSKRIFEDMEKLVNEISGQRAAYERAETISTSSGSEVDMVRTGLAKEDDPICQIRGDVDEAVQGDNPEGETKENRVMRKQEDPPTEGGSDEENCVRKRTDPPANRACSSDESSDIYHVVEEEASEEAPSEPVAPRKNSKLRSGPPRPEREEENKKSSVARINPSTAFKKTGTESIPIFVDDDAGDEAEPFVVDLTEVSSEEIMMQGYRNRMARGLGTEKNGNVADEPSNALIAEKTDVSTDDPLKDKSFANGLVELSNVKHRLADVADSSNNVEGAYGFDEPPKTGGQIQDKVVTNEACVPSPANSRVSDTEGRTDNEVTDSEQEGRSTTGLSLMHTENLATEEDHTGPVDMPGGLIKGLEAGKQKELLKEVTHTSEIDQEQANAKISIAGHYKGNEADEHASDDRDASTGNEKTDDSEANEVKDEQDNNSKEKGTTKPSSNHCDSYMVSIGNGKHHYEKTEAGKDDEVKDDYKDDIGLDNEKVFESEDGRSFERVLSAENGTTLEESSAKLQNQSIYSGTGIGNEVAPEEDECSPLQPSLFARNDQSLGKDRKEVEWSIVQATLEKIKKFAETDLNEDGGLSREKLELLEQLDRTLENPSLLTDLAETDGSLPNLAQLDHMSTVSDESSGQFSRTKFMEIIDKHNLLKSQRYSDKDPHVAEHVESSQQASEQYSSSQGPTYEFQRTAENTIKEESEEGPLGRGNVGGSTASLSSTSTSSKKRKLPSGEGLEHNLPANATEWFPMGGFLSCKPNHNTGEAIEAKENKVFELPKAWEPYPEQWDKKVYAMRDEEIQYMYSDASNLDSKHTHDLSVTLGDQMAGNESQPGDSQQRVMYPESHMTRGPREQVQYEETQDELNVELRQDSQGFVVVVGSSTDVSEPEKEADEAIILALSSSSSEEVGAFDKEHEENTISTSQASDTKELKYKIDNRKDERSPGGDLSKSLSAGSFAPSGEPAEEGMLRALDFAELFLGQDDSESTDNEAAFAEQILKRPSEKVDIASSVNWKDLRVEIDCDAQQRHETINASDYSAISFDHRQEASASSSVVEATQELSSPIPDEKTLMQSREIFIDIADLDEEDADAASEDPVDLAELEKEWIKQSGSMKEDPITATTDDGVQSSPNNLTEVESGQQPGELTAGGLVQQEKERAEQTEAHKDGPVKYTATSDEFQPVNKKKGDSTTTAQNLTEEQPASQEQENTSDTIEPEILGATRQSVQALAAVPPTSGVDEIEKEFTEQPDLDKPTVATKEEETQPSAQDLSEVQPTSRRKEYTISLQESQQPYVTNTVKSIDQTPRMHQSKHFDFIEEVDESENASAYISRMTTLKKGGHLPNLNTDALGSFVEEGAVSDGDEDGDGAIEVDLDVGFVKKSLAPIFSDEQRSWDDLDDADISDGISVEDRDRYVCRDRYATSVEEDEVVRGSGSSTHFGAPNTARVHMSRNASSIEQQHSSHSSSHVSSSKASSSFADRDDESFANSSKAAVAPLSSSMNDSENENIRGQRKADALSVDEISAQQERTRYQPTGYESDNDEWLRKRDIATRKTKNPKSWITRTTSGISNSLSFAVIDTPKAVNGVDAARRLSTLALRRRGGNHRSRISGTRAWALSYKDRCSDHTGYFDVDYYSLIDSSDVSGRQPHPLDFAPWEMRDVKQYFLQDQSISFSKNWFGKLQKTRGNQRVREPVARPRSMEMPMENKPHPEEWTQEWYKVWKAPSRSNSSLDSCSYSDSDSEGGLDSQSGASQSIPDDSSSCIRKSGSSHSASVCRSFSDDAHSRSDAGFSDNYVDSYEDTPQCGELINVKPKIGERVTRIHPDYTCQLRRSRWRKKYFPRGTFPYNR